MQWFQLFVKAPAGNGYTTPKLMKRVDDHLASHAAHMIILPSGDGLPVQEPDGSFEVRVQDPSRLKLVKHVLTGHYGLEIVREQAND